MWCLFLGFWMTAVTVAAFALTPPVKGLGHLGKIIYFHVPYAWVACLAFACSVFYSARYLRRQALWDDVKAATACELGLLFTVIATLTGAIFAKCTWGAFWNWDPRQTSIFILLLIYMAYFALRQAVPDLQRRYTLSAVYALVAFPTVPLLVFIIPRTTHSLHPNNSVLQMDMLIRMILVAAIVGFTGLFVWLFPKVSAIEYLGRRAQEVDHE